VAGNDSFTVLLTNCDGADTSTTFTDTSVGGSTHTITANGNAQVSTTSPKFGSGALLLDGSGDYLSIPDSADFEYGTGDFAFDTWIKPDVVSGDRGIYRHLESGSNHISFFQRGQTLRLNIVQGGTTFMNFGTGNILSTGTWQHVGFARNGNNFYIIFDGTSTSAGSSALATPTFTVNLTLGSNVSDSHFDGRFDECRISKGTSRGYEAAYSVPTVAYSIPMINFDVTARASTSEFNFDVKGRISNLPAITTDVTARATTSSFPFDVTGRMSTDKGFNVISKLSTSSFNFDVTARMATRSSFSITGIPAGLGPKRFDLYLYSSTGALLDTVTSDLSAGLTITDVFPSTPLTGPSTYTIHCEANEYLPNQERNFNTTITFSVDGTGALLAQFPNAPNTLFATAKEGAKAQLDWKYNTFEQEVAPSEFNVYHNSGGGGVDYGTIQATVTYVTGVFQYQTTLTSLTDGLTYVFGVRSKTGANEEQNTNTASALIDGTAPAPVPFTVRYL